MKNLLLMRHAKSSWKDLSLPDHQRPLNRRGKRDALRMGRYLQEEGVQVDVILCSTAKRARASAKGFLEAYTFEGKIYHIDDLYHANYETFVILLNQLPNSIDSAMIIGHNPAMDDFLEVICNEYVHMPTASVAYIKFSIEKWAELSEISSGKLTAFWKAREISK